MNNGALNTLDGLDDQEESVRIAVRALDDMRNRRTTPAELSSRPTPSISSPSSSSSSSSLPGPISPQLKSSSFDTQTHNSLPSDHPSSPSSPDFVSRMSQFPLVKTALQTYKQGKASSRVVKYGADFVESSVKSVSRPVIGRLPVNVNRLDEFACRQLDRLDRYRRPSSGENVNGSSTVVPFTTDDDHLKLKSKTSDADGRSEKMASPTIDDRKVPSWLEANSQYVISHSLHEANSTSRSSTPTPNGDHKSPRKRRRSQDMPSPDSRSANRTDRDERQVAQRSRWQAVLLEAGGLSAALSEESMRRLKYCLQWLQYATAHIDAQILVLRDFTASLQPIVSSSSANPNGCPNSNTTHRTVPEEHIRRLTDVRRDIVHTIRQVVDVVSKYAGGALPEPARTRVRGFILTLPQRWATRASVTTRGGAGVASSSVVTDGGRERESETVSAAASGSGAGARRGLGQRRAAQRERGVDGGSSSGLRSGPPSRASSPSASPRMGRGAAGMAFRGERGGDTVRENGAGHGGEGSVVSNGAAIMAAQRILTLATESLDMMRGVTGVVKDSLDRAETWVGRLRTVGIQRGAEEGTEEGSEYGFDPEHPQFNVRGSTTTTTTHSRTGSLSFSDDLEMVSSPLISSSDSSTVWGSSIPSTPGASYAPYAYAGAPSPAHGIGLGLGEMSLGSTSGTPRSVVVGLPDEGVDGEVGGVLGSDGGMKSGERRQVRVAGVYPEEERERMDVDEV